MKRDMRDIFDRLSSLPDFSSILIICDHKTDFPELFGRTLNSRVNVVGPARSMAAALLLAAQTPVDLAVIAPQLAQREERAQLVARLERDWGVPCLVADEPPTPAAEA